MPGAVKKSKSSFKKSPKGVKKPKLSRQSAFQNQNALKPEAKFMDYVVDIEPFYNASTPQLLNSMIIGVNNYNRIGTKVLLKGLEYRLTVYRTAAGVTNTLPSAARFIIVYDRQPVLGTPAAWTDILAAQDSGGTSFTNQFLNFPNVSEKDRFLILHDEVISLPQVDANVAGPTGFMAWDSAQPMHRKGYIKLNKLVSIFNNSSQITEGQLLAFFQNNNATCTNNATTPYGFQFATRTSYTDM